MLKRCSFKKIFSLVIAIAIIINANIIAIASPGVSVAEAGSGHETGFAAEFRQPSREAKPYIRWWITPGLMSEAETKLEVRKMAEAGFGGIELVALVGMANFGSSGWNNAMKWALEEAIECGITLDFTIGQAWPIKTPAISDPNDIRSEQGLFYKAVDFTTSDDSQSYSESQIPFPDEQFETNRPYELVAVTAAKKIDNATYDPESVAVITDKLTNFTDNTNVNGVGIQWQPEMQGDWTIFYLYRQGTSKSGSVVVDHFNREATEAVVKYWDDVLMAGELRDLYERNGGCIFGDSLELGEKTKSNAAFWTANILEEFRNRRGYDLTPYLPCIFIKDFYPYYAHSNHTDADPDFDFGIVGARIREDFFETLTELFTENHIKVIREWAEGHNMSLRYQSYGVVMEITEPTLEVDVVETESWGSKDIIDMYRLQSGVVHMTGRKLYSTESAAVINLAWAQTWTGSHRAGQSNSDPYWADDGSNYVYRPDGNNQDAGILYHFNRQMAAGVNRIVMHGFSYKSNLMRTWPGDSFMSMGNFCNE